MRIKSDHQNGRSLIFLKLWLLIRFEIDNPTMAIGMDFVIQNEFTFSRQHKNKPVMRQMLLAGIQRAGHALKQMKSLAN